MNGRTLVITLVFVLGSMAPSMMNSTTIMLEESTTEANSGNNSTGCGYNESYAYISGWYNNGPYYVGDSFNGSVYSNCNMLNQTMYVIYNVTAPNGTYVQSGAWNWTAYSITQTHYHYLQNLVYGTYTVNLGLYYYDNSQTFTWLDGYSYNFTVSNSSSSGCGYNSSYAYLDPNSYYTSYTAGDTYEAYIDTYCALLGNTMRVDWYIMDNNNSMNLTTGSFQWNASYSTYYYDINYTNISAGSYTLYATLYTWNTTNQGWTYLDYDYDSFTVSSSSSNNSGCGYEESYAYISAWNNYYPLFEGDSLNATVYTYCNMLNQTMIVNYTIYQWINNNSELLELDNGSWSWTAYNLYDYHYFYMSNLSIGNYTVSTSMSYIDSSTQQVLLDSYTYHFNVTAPSGCGYDASYTMFYMSGLYEGDEYILGTYMPYPYMSTYCNVLGAQMIINWELNSGSTNIDYGSWNWTAYNTSDYHPLNFTNLGVGNYSFSTSATMVWQGTTYNLGEEYANFSVVAQNNSGMGCGYDASYAYLSLSGLYNGDVYYVGDEVYAYIANYCNVLNATIVNEWWISIYSSETNGTIIDYGNSSYTAQNDWDELYFNFSQLASGPLQEGSYNFYIETWIILESNNSWYYVGSRSVNFGVIDTNTDTDGDGWTDQDEYYCYTNASDNNSVPTDFDMDGTCDVIDSDDDNDSYSDWEEWDCGSNATDANDVPTDFDGDGECDVIDADDDGDGVDDIVDSCPETASGEVVDQEGCEILLCPYDQIDCNGNCVDISTDITNCGACGNACPYGASCNSGLCVTQEEEETDSDNDGIADVLDNCPNVANADQLDADDDGIGTACDVDEVEESGDDEEEESISGLPSIGMFATLASIIGACVVISSRRKFE